jgi:prepilin-type N-terminal cleavage/methylation domain-containing protein
MSKNQGFTFMELMVIIAVIGILASIATPNFIAWLPNYRLRSSAEDIQSTLQLARLTAIKENSTVTVTFNTANDSYQASVGGQTFRSGQMPAGIDINSAVFGGGPTVQFDSRGFVNGSAGSAQVRNKQGRSKTITVNITGNSRIN